MLNDYRCDLRQSLVHLSHGTVDGEIRMLVVICLN